MLGHDAAGHDDRDRETIEAGRQGPEREHWRRRERCAADMAVQHIRIVVDGDHDIHDFRHDSRHDSRHALYRRKGHLLGRDCDERKSQSDARNSDGPQMPAAAAEAEDRSRSQT